jgi:FkbM family methyltransferase
MTHSPLTSAVKFFARKCRSLVQRARRAWNAGTVRRLRESLGELRERLAEQPAGELGDTPRSPAPGPVAPAASSASATPPSAPTHRDYEDVLTRVYLALVCPGDFAIDIGANVGRHTLGLSDRVHPAGCVLAFEPLPVGRAAIERLYRRPEYRPLRGNVILSPLALGREPGSSEFVFAVDVPGWSGLKERVYDGPTRLERIPVRIETLDRLLGGLRHCRFVKIDAEGGEYDALRGGEQFLRRTRPVVAFEFGANSCTGYGVRPADMGEFLDRLGYRLLDINGRPLTPDEFARSADLQEVWDYFAVPSEQPDLADRVRELCKV